MAHENTVQIGLALPVADDEEFCHGSTSLTIDNIIINGNPKWVKRKNSSYVAAV